MSSANALQETSALDYNTERQLCLNLQQWAAGSTVFLITPSLSSIQSSDLILVMHEGRLVEQVWLSMPSNTIKSPWIDIPGGPARGTR